MTFPIGKISLCPVLSGGFTACGKTQVFVSGYRFSDTASSSESDAPLGAGRRHLTFSVASLHVTPQCLLLLESRVIVDPPAAGSDDSGCIVANPEVAARIGKLWSISTTIQPRLQRLQNRPILITCLWAREISLICAPLFNCLRCIVLTCPLLFPG